MATAEQALKPKGLVNKLCEVMAEAGYIQKRGRNEKMNYNYATEADVVDQLREKLALRNVFVFPSVVSAERKEHSKTSTGGTMFITDILVKWTFLDGDTGETHECMMPGCGTDTGDKGIYKAITGSSKYLFLKAFMLPTGDDPEDEKIDKEEAKAAAKAVAVEKLKTHAAGDESIMLTPWKEGRIALSGNGLAIIKASLTLEEKAELGILYSTVDNVTHMPAAKGFNLVDACTRHNVPTVWMDVPTEKPSQTLTSQLEASIEKGNGITKAVIPPLGNTRPIIQSVLMKSGTRKTKDGKSVPWEFMNVVWGDSKFVCWDNKLWPLLEAGKGKPAALLTVPSFDGKKDATIEGIESIGENSFEQILREFRGDVLY